METHGHIAGQGLPRPLHWRSLAVVVGGHLLALAALVHVRSQVDREFPPPIYAEVLTTQVAAPAEPAPPPPEPVAPVIRPEPTRPTPVDPVPTTQLAVPETAPAAPAAPAVQAPVDVAVPTPVAPAPPAAEPARAGAEALAGNPDEVRRYIAAIMRQLNRHKTYPRELKKAKVEGTVVIEFTIDAAGRLLAAAVKQGSGHPELDRAAMEMLARANPLPAIPDYMNRDELALAIPVEYSLITDR